MKWRLRLKKIHVVSLVAIEPQRMSFVQPDQQPSRAPQWLTNDLAVSPGRAIQFSST
jgi:hypothetical protein